MIIVDSSVALQWVLPEDDAAFAERLLGRSDLAAPDILFVESANVLAKKVRTGNATLEGARAALQLIRDSVALIDDTDDLLEDGIRLSVELAHPLYDCCFLACALHLDGLLATRDQAFAKRISASRYVGRVTSPAAP